VLLRIVNHAIILKTSEVWRVAFFQILVGLPLAGAGQGEFPQRASHFYRRSFNHMLLDTPLTNS